MLVEIGHGLWYAEAQVRFFGMRLQTRMSVVALPDGGLALISPLEPDPALLGALAKLGPVRHLISPNKIHNIGLPGMAAAFPTAKVWASPGLPERRPDLCYAGILDDVLHPDWAAVLDQRLTRGNVFFSEVVFLHRGSRTLIVADLVESISGGTVLDRRTRIMAGLMRIAGRTLPSPEFRAFTTDAVAAADRLDEIGRWPFVRILPAHGDIVTENAHEVLGGVRDFLVREVTERPAWRAALYRGLAKLQ